MTSHIALQGSLQVNYFFNPHRRAQPFVGAGMSFLMFQSAKISREVTVDISSLMSGGGPPSGGLGNLGGGLAEGGLPFFKGQTVQPYGLLGVSYQLSRNARFLLTTDYYYNNRKEVRGVPIDNQRLNVSFSAGLQFELNKKTKKYFQYL